LAKKLLVYALTAAVLGALLVVAPLFFVPLAEHYGAEYAPQTLSERVKILEALYGLRGNAMQGYLTGIITFAVGLMTATVAYLLVKAKFSR
jgi:hypothetical protein